MKGTSNLSRAEKILLFLYEYSKGGVAKARYEDIVVGLFENYPHDFHLKGYPQYPDSGDLIHKPLYDFKKKGYMNAVSKVFSLTERGVELAKQLEGAGEGNLPDISQDRLSRSAETEVSRIKILEGLTLFVGGEEDKLSENDLYNYLGVTARTQKNAFIGRLETMNALVSELAVHTNDPLSAAIINYHNHLMAKHGDVIEFFTKN